jgi:broad specificity phosphatase PhoE
MRATFVRHGESTGNAGLPCNDPSLAELTEKGRKQAQQVAKGWVEAPALIVTSPFLRTRQTTAATVKRFPKVPVEVWPVQEFTYLDPNQWNGTSGGLRLPAINAFWKACNPNYCDGPGAESFATLLRRVEGVLSKLASLPEDALVYVFSHGQFMQAVRSTVMDNGTSNLQKMQFFLHDDGLPTIKNAELMFLRWKNGRWGHGTDV